MLDFSFVEEPVYYLKKDQVAEFLEGELPF